MVDNIISVSFSINGRVEVDLVRAEEDPWWETYSRGLDLDDPAQLQKAIQNYISAYLRQENLLSDVPFSCGPASIYNLNVEVKNDRVSSNLITAGK